jgi:glyoxylase-like metal-dependent hydrolase (beta-lactamase superfamily II)
MQRRPRWSEVTDLPVRHLFLTHHHMAAGRGVPSVLAQAAAARRMAQRPTLSFADEVRVSLDDRDVVLGWLGRGHTAGDPVAWLPQERVLFAGGLVAADVTPGCGEAHLAEWRSATLARVAAFRAGTLVPGGRDAALAAARTDLAGRFGDTAGFADRLPGNVARAYAELQGLPPPLGLTARVRRAGRRSGRSRRRGPGRHPRWCVAGDGGCGGRGAGGRRGCRRAGRRRCR